MRIASSMEADSIPLSESLISLTIEHNGSDAYFYLGGKSNNAFTTPRERSSDNEMHLNRAKSSVRTNNPTHRPPVEYGYKERTIFKRHSNVPLHGNTPSSTCNRQCMMVINTISSHYSMIAFHVTNLSLPHVSNTPGT